MRGIEVNYKGNHYNSISSACKDQEVALVSVMNYISRNNCTAEEAIDRFVLLREGIGEGSSSKRIECEADGIKFRSMTKLAEYLGVVNTTLSKIIDKLGSVELAVEYIRNREEVSYTTKSGVYSTKESVAAALNTSPTTIRGLAARRGISFQEAVNLIEDEGLASVVALKSEERYTLGDSTNLTLTRACVMTHARVSDVKAISDEKGISIQDVLTERFSRYLSKSRIINGIECSTLMEMAVALNETYSSFVSSIRRLGDVDKAIAYQLEMNVNPSTLRLRCRSTGSLKELKSAYEGRLSGLNYVTAYCSTCEKKLLMTSKDASQFEHSTEFCNSHEVAL